jgi:UrcA family protein
MSAGVTTVNIEPQRAPIASVARNMIYAVAFAWLLGIAPVAVKADPQPTSEPEVAQATVSFTDLDLTTTLGVGQARRRLVAAAQRLCHRFSDSLKASNNATSAACYRETLADVTQRFDAMLAAARDKGTHVARSTR